MSGGEMADGSHYIMVGGNVLWKTVVAEDVEFPYISTYLGFRELPVYLRSIDAARAGGRIADVLLVDGSGILHPRRAGIASQLAPNGFRRVSR